MPCRIALVLTCWWAVGCGSGYIVYGSGDAGDPGGGDGPRAPDASTSRPPDASVSHPPDANLPPPPDANGAPSADAGGGATTFRFAIVGDTRPPVINDTSGYPTAIITKIWQDVEALSPRPDFALSTGDYMFASTTSNQAAPQLDKYLTARMQFHGTVYAALGNHECTGATTSNCGPGTTDGTTNNYSEFMTRMVQPLGFTEPYYKVDLHATDNSWTAKLVFVAGNAWTSAQASWLAQALSEPTTYTFVIRHESNTATTAPGVSPSKAIIDAHPYTLLIVGHAHTYQHLASDREVISGNGGAPLTTGSNYGYATVERRADGAIVFKEYDYQTNAVVDTWAVHADGSPA